MRGTCTFSTVEEKLKLVWDVDFESFTATPCNFLHTFLRWHEYTFFWFTLNHFQNNLTQLWEACLQWIKGTSGTTSKYQEQNARIDTPTSGLTPELRPTPGEPPTRHLLGPGSGSCGNCEGLCHIYMKLVSRDCLELRKLRSWLFKHNM